MYELLTNVTYLYLLQHPEECNHVNYSKIARETGRSRQTVANEYTDLVSHNVNFYDNKLGITYFFNEVPNLTERALCIYLDITNCKATLPDAIRDLSRGRASIAKYWQSALKKVDKKRKNIKIEPNSGVYAIIHNNQIIYIGSSSDVANRFKQHRYNIDTHQQFSPLAQYCDERDISSQNLTFQLLIQTPHFRDLEKDMIKTIAPICNTQFL